MSIKLDKDKMTRAIVFDAMTSNIEFLTHGVIEYSYEPPYVVATVKADQRAIATIRVSWEIAFGYRTPWCARLKVSGVEAGRDFHVFFGEQHYQGHYDEYDGFRIMDTTYTVATRTGGVETATSYTWDETVEHEYKIFHTPVPECSFYLDGALVVTHTTNVSTLREPPWRLCSECFSANPPYTADGKIFARYPNPFWAERTA